MFYRKNVSAKERIARLVAGVLMILCGLIGLQTSALGLFVACVGVFTIATGMFGFCPACAMAGRKSLGDR
jgi:uncharacterized membrane protein HdeD (DUF308 family)